jgi:hypothetical protein
MTIAPTIAENFDRAPVRFDETFKDFNRRGLARAVRPEQTEALANAHFEVKSLNRRDLAVSFEQPDSM